MYSTLSGSSVSSVTGDLITSYSYDAVGNETSTTDPSGATSFMYYDALGREIATVAPARDLGNGLTQMPLTLMYRDAFGYRGGSALATALYNSSAPNDENYNYYLLHGAGM